MRLLLFSDLTDEVDDRPERTLFVSENYFDFFLRVIMDDMR